MLSRISISFYRSIRKLELPLGPVNVLVGANGCGKSNLYSAVRLLSCAARGALSRTLAAEGGMPSVLWAGPRRSKKPIRLSIEADIDDYTYHLGLGLPQGGGVFHLDPMVKDEFLSVPVEGKKRPLTLMERTRAFAYALDSDCVRVEWQRTLRHEESFLPQLADPARFPELFNLRGLLTSWRFYDQMRTDSGAPARSPQPAVRTWRLADDGSDLAAALATVQANGDDELLAETIDEAFGARLSIALSERGELELMLQMPGLARPLAARELSDGTLRYLYLAAALLSPDPAPLLAINEPETSLHPQLLAPLAHLVERASRRSQIWLTTHSERLAEMVASSAGTEAIPLALRGGETVVA